MLIHRLKVSGLLSFGPTGIDLPLEPLNVLIGPNGSGKSNLLEILSLLRAAPRRLSRPIREQGGVDNWFWKGKDGSDFVYLEASFVPRLRGLRFSKSNPHHLQHALSFENLGGRLELTSEEIYLERKGSTKQIYQFEIGAKPEVFKVAGLQEKSGPLSLKSKSGRLRSRINSEESILSQIRDPETYPVFFWLQENYENIALYRNWSFGPEANWRRAPSAHGRNDQLDEDGDNLALVASLVALKAKKALVSSLQILIEGVEDLLFVPFEGNVQLFLDEGRGRQIPATRLSDGTLRYLALLTILHHPTPPPLVAIEEPELGMHPDVIPHIGELLIQASKRTQLVVTTHSRTLIDALSDVPSSVVVCGKEHGESVFERLDGGRLQAWLNDYSLGDLWSKGELGGNRW